MIDMQLFIEGCSALDIDLNEKQQYLFGIYLDLLLEWNQRFNLTAITDPKEIMVQHFLDSLSILKLGIIKEDSIVLDIGSGAGFPGIPLKIIIPEIKLTLIDSVQKKINFLEEVICRLQLEKTTAIHGRAEDLAREKEHREAYDVVTSRAVAELRILSEFCLPFVKLNGFFLSHKGPGAAEELKQADKAVELLGGQWIGTQEVEIPYSDRTHNLVIIKKVKNTSKKYPRSPGKPKKYPL